jgi:hypothetical protein
VARPRDGELTAAAEPGAAAGAAARPLAVLRELRRRLATDAPPDAAAFADIVDRSLGSDWARRRALAALFARRLPADLQDALALVQRLSTPADRGWALADLVASRQWSDGDFALLLSAADSPALRRRLALRRAAR